ncbi:deaminase [Nocardioides sp. Root122]|uniref:dihydrofolate reductase family protein n=1 Tax=Nocardioides TaxID=1839 RepID=UPI000703BC1C|nr:MULTISPECIES: dihydrofolate reductase family protein [Nocardioides]KQV63316.1 deaminase [Nocardioides sp. Root122]MCK9825951.1 dihydrofolate reductase family protein [Nocardioides cavernae]
MPLVRVTNFTVSLDGFGAGEPQSLEAPFGHAGMRLHQWMFATWEDDAPTGIDAVWAQRWDVGFGAEIMGANKFGPPGWQDDPDWRGWWGEDPPFHTPTYVLTHRPREPLEMEGGTTFHFLSTSLPEALAIAQEAAGDLDVRIGGGATTVRDFVAAGLVDHLHVVVAPILLGHGTRLWDGLAGLEEAFAIEAVSSPTGVVHLSLSRRPSS